MSRFLTATPRRRAVATRGRLLLAMLALGAGMHGAVLPAQEVSPPPAESRMVEGRVLRATAAEPRPVEGIWVVLHRVASDWSGALDSVRSRRDGGYTIRYRTSGMEDALYFVSADYAGIAYFSAPLRANVVRGEAAELYVFDTTTTPVPIRVLGRHLIISSPAADGHREVVEVFELANDTTVTRVTGGADAPTFSSILPPEAENFQPGQGDFSPGALIMSDGRMLSHAPIAPGLKQISYSYVLPPEAFPLRFPVEREVEVMEVLLEDPAAEATGAGLTEVTPVGIEQRMFRRFLAQQVGASGVLTITAPAPAQRGLAANPVLIVALIAAAVMLVALGAALFARRQRQIAVTPPAAPAPLTDDPDALARAIAQLDEGHERTVGRDAQEQAVYAARRAELKRRLGDALAARRGGS